MDYQLPNRLIHIRKLVHSIECSNPKLLATIAQVESDKSMNDFEAIVSFILLSNPVTNNKATTSNKSNGGIISNTNAKISSASVGGHDRSIGIDLRFHKREEYTLSKESKITLRKWQASNLEVFEKSKCKTLGPSN